MALPETMVEIPDAELLADAHDAMEEMRKRALRYKEAPADDSESILKELDVREGGTGLVAQMNTVHAQIFADHPIAVGKAISKKERDHLGKAATPSLTYGEVTFNALAIALSKIKHIWGVRPSPGAAAVPEEAEWGAPPVALLQEPGGVFVDLGSGTGKGVIAAALFHHFSLCMGIEVMEGLYRTSIEIKRAWDETYRSAAGATAVVEFHHGDAADLSAYDWSGADIVFANSTCFDDALMRKIAECCASLRNGAFVITFTKSLPSPLFTVLDHQMCQMSWGGATVFIQQKSS